MPELPDPVRRRLAEIFGDTEPEVTRDELDDPRPPERDRDWYDEQRPPHHDRD
jgi:hypothetical protein